MDEGPEFSIVLPAFNEERNVAPIAERLIAVMKPYGRLELIFVNDGSRDGTLAEIKALARRGLPVRYVSFARNFGHQAALRAGLHHARGQAVILMDCDFEHPPEVIPQLIAAWKDGAKAVVTQRLPSPQRPFLKRVSSNLFYWLLNLLSDIEIDPGSADFLLLDREAVDCINGLDERDLFLRGMVRWLGFAMSKVTYRQGTRRAGQSSYSLGRMINLALTGLAAHTIKPLRIAIHLSIGFALFGVVMLIYSIASLSIGHAVAGWTSIMATIAIIGAGQFMVLGIIGEYVGRLVRETRDWPAYIIAETDAALMPAPAPAAAPVRRRNRAVART